MESSQLYFTESLSKVINSTLEGTYSYIYHHHYHSILLLIFNKKTNLTFSLAAGK